VHKAVIDFLMIVILLAAAGASLLWPLRRRGSAGSTEDPDVEALQAAHHAKLREIRDLELDFRLGKLSRSDFGPLDAALRAEAIAITRELDRVSERGGHSPPPTEAG
jgi:hypothetical protein